VGIRTLHGRWSVATGDFDGDGKWDLVWRKFRHRRERHLEIGQCRDPTSLADGPPGLERG
jgi:hypothetical protein